MKKERLKIIWDLLLTNNIHSTKKIIKTLEKENFHQMTVRRDLHELEKIGLIKTSYATIELLSNDPDPFINIENHNKVINLNEKEKIAKKAITLIDKEDTIFIGTGSTCQQFTKFINKPINTIITNGLNTLSMSLNNNNIKERIIIGGVVSKETNSINGLDVINKLEHFHFTKCFITCDSLDKNGNLYSKNYNESIFLAKIIELSQKVYILADTTKQEKKYFYKFGNIKQIEKLINEKMVNQID